MQPKYWQKQTSEQPLFPDLLWSRPETKATSGKLLIIGGNAHGFAVPAEAYVRAQQAGIGAVRVLLPASVKSLVRGVLEAVEYATSNPSGGFSQLALGEVLSQSEWADGVLLAGDFGRNSETAILLEKFLDKYTGQVTLTKDAVDYFIPAPLPLLNRENLTIVVSFGQLQKLAIGAHAPQAFTFGMDLLRCVDSLHALSTQYPVNIITRHLDTLFAATGGQVSTTKLSNPSKVWRTSTAAYASTWWLQNAAQPYQALTTAVIEAG